jgi:hypothetical protein
LVLPLILLEQGKENAGEYEVKIIPDGPGPSKQPSIGHPFFTPRIIDLAGIFFLRVDVDQI